MKRLVILLLIVCPLMASADVGDKFNVGALAYKIISEDPKEVELKGLNLLEGHDSDLLIPTTVTNSDGTTYTVTSIGKSAFSDCTSLISITIPTSVKNISEYAFCNCLNLTSVIMSEGVETIGEKAFSRCESLPSITIPASVTSIGQVAFRCCIRLTSINVAAENKHYMSYDGVLFDKEMKSILVYPEGKTATSYTIPDGVTHIGDFAFNFELSNSYGYEEGKRLTTIIIPEGVTSIGWLSFGHCNGLTSITLPASLTSIDAGSFAFCKGLTSVRFADNSHLTSIGIGAFEYSSLTSIKIPDGVTHIGNMAFDSCYDLKTVTIPASMTNIGSNAFIFSTNVTDVYCYADPSVLKWPEKDGLFSEDTGFKPDKATLCHVVGDVELWEKKFPKVNVTFVDDLVTEGKEDPTKSIAINEENFPDENFRNWLLSQDCGADGVLTNEELENVTSLDISRLEIHDLKGIEYFFALKTLNCMTNKLTTLDLSNNIALEKLNCLGNRLTTINLQENKKLRYLSCVSNQLTALDISGCTELDTLACSNNQLTALNVSMNTKLTCLECYSNQLSTLDLSKNTALRRIHCNANQLTTLDVSKNTALTMLQCSSNLLTTLDVTKNSAMTSLSCTDNKLTTLHVSNNKSLESIICFHNQLTSLDVSGCSALKTLNCTGNQLTTLDLSGCSALEGLHCNDNQLATLDLSENTSLTTIFCYRNQIKGAGMDALVESLPTVSEGSLNVMYFENEQNVMTSTQVATAKAKGWTPYLCTYSFSEEYAGSETNQDDYRPFVEEGKVWKVGNCQAILDNSVHVVDYYFDGDTIIDGKTCKQMMCQQYVNPEDPDYAIVMQYPLLQYVGAWYEEDKKVYFYNANNKQMRLMYDFSLDDNGLFHFFDFQYVVGPKQTGGINGFKGVYREVWECGDGGNTFQCAPWMEGVGLVYGPPTTNVFNVELADPAWYLMSCTVGDEVIYCNSEVDDPFNMGAKKRRFDFNHTIKTQPKTPRRAGELDGLYGEYNNELLDVKLNPLDDAYLVRITDKAGQSVYEKAINAGNIVALNIDISEYPEGQYTVTIENSKETFTGQFDTLASAIKEQTLSPLPLKEGGLYNLQGQRIKTLQKGLNIIDGKKVYVR